MTVLGRIGQPADIAELVVLLAHSDHRWITAGSPARTSAQTAASPDPDTDRSAGRRCPAIDRALPSGGCLFFWTSTGPSPIPMTASRGALRTPSMAWACRGWRSDNSGRSSDRRSKTSSLPLAWMRAAWDGPWSCTANGSGTTACTRTAAHVDKLAWHKEYDRKGQLAARWRLHRGRAQFTFTPLIGLQSSRG